MLYGKDNHSITTTHILVWHPNSMHICNNAAERMLFQPRNIVSLLLISMHSQPTVETAHQDLASLLFFE